jgi:hypothetical protein
LFCRVFEVWVFLSDGDGISETLLKANTKNARRKKSKKNPKPKPKAGC